MSSLLRQASEDGEGNVSERAVDLAIQGNLCRCTGYRSILKAFYTFGGGSKGRLNGVTNGSHNGHSGGKDEVDLSESIEEYKEYDKKAEPPFPKELKNGEFASKALSFSPPSGAHWHRPTSVKEVMQLASKYESVRFMGGGTGSFKVPNYKDPEAFIQVTQLRELHTVDEIENGVLVGSAVNMRKLQTLCQERSSCKNGNGEIFRLLSKVLESWVCQQVRNAATVGGHVGWAHPCSDLIPIFMASGCCLRVLGFDGKKRDVPLDDEYFSGPFKTDKLKNGELILGLLVPFAKRGQKILYYRRARRKEFDLPIANAALTAVLEDDGTYKDVKVVVGGLESNFPSAKAFPAKMMKKIAEYIEGKSLSSIDKDQLKSVVLSELEVDHSAPGKLGQYRQCLAMVFVERFLEDVKKKDKVPHMRSSSKHPTTSLLHRTKPDDPFSAGSLSLPIPHQWTAEQTSGEARKYPPTRLNGSSRTIKKLHATKNI